MAQEGGVFSGYQAPVHRILTRFISLGGVQRELLGALVVGVAGLWFVTKAWPVVLLCPLGHAYMAYRTKQDPVWWKTTCEQLKLRWHVFLKGRG